MKKVPTPLAFVTGLFQQPIENKERITKKSKVNNLEKLNIDRKEQRQL